MDDRPLSARDVAELCGVELKTVHNWVAQGLLPHFRTPGRHLRFQATDVRRFLSNRTDAASDSAATRRIVAIVPKNLRTSLKRHLRGCSVEFADDPYSGLIRAGRDVPDVIVLDPRAFRSQSASQYIRALQRELPRLTIVWLSEKRPRGTEAAVSIPRRDLRRLADLVAA